MTWPGYGDLLQFNDEPWGWVEEPEQESEEAWHWESMTPPSHIVHFPAKQRPHLALFEAQYFPSQEAWCSSLSRVGPPPCSVGNNMLSDILSFSLSLESAFSSPCTPFPSPCSLSITFAAADLSLMKAYSS